MRCPKCPTLLSLQRRCLRPAAVAAAARKGTAAASSSLPGLVMGRIRWPTLPEECPRRRDASGLPYRLGVSACASMPGFAASSPLPGDWLRSHSLAPSRLVCWKALLRGVGFSAVASIGTASTSISATFSTSSPWIAGRGRSFFTSNRSATRASSCRRRGPLRGSSRCL